MSRSRQNGFSLVELLAVMVVMILAASLIVPAAHSIFEGNKLAHAGQLVAGQLETARQSSISRNRSVEVRFFRCANPENPGQSINDHSSWKFQAMQVLEVVNASRIVPLGKVQSLPAGKIIGSAPKLTSLFDSNKRTLRAGTDLIPRVGAQYEYYAVRFRPDGSTDLAPTDAPWFLTLYDGNKGDPRDTPPPNFITVELDPANGAIKYYRP